MNKLIGVIISLAVAALFVGEAQSDDLLETKQVRPKMVSFPSVDKLNPVETLKSSDSKDFSQGYQMVTDVFDGWGGGSESDNYRIPVNSGGQPSAIGISQSPSYGLKAGYVHASGVKRGDANADAVIDIGDVVYLINYLFKGGTQPYPQEAGDINCDGVVDIGDVVYLINYLFKGGPPPNC